MAGPPRNVKKRESSMLPVQTIDARPDLSMLLAGQLTGREDPSAIFDAADGDVLLTHSRGVSVLNSALRYRESGHAELPLVDDPGPRWHAAEVSESAGVELAHHAGIHEAEHDLTQLGCRLIDPEHTGYVRQLPPWNRLERNADLPRTVGLADEPEAMRCRELIRQQHRLVRREIIPPLVPVTDHVPPACERRRIDRAEGSPVGDRKDARVGADHGSVVADLFAVYASPADT